MNQKEFCIINCSKCNKRVRYYFDDYMHKALFVLDRSQGHLHNLLCKECEEKEKLAEDIPIENYLKIYVKDSFIEHTFTGDRMEKIPFLIGNEETTNFKSTEIKLIINGEEEKEE